MGRSEPSWSRVLMMTLVSIAAFAYGGWTGLTYADLATNGIAVSAVSVRTVEGSRRGHYTTTFDVGGGECVISAIHAEPGERVRVYRDRHDPTRCVADAFFPTMYWPLACFAIGSICVSIALSDVRILRR